ncbi:MAG: radical SAM protein [Candidatus Tectomicrobia bacterium]|uniref:Radical SAM protein n=1 Tax=Tectimicrobiota bacterium TaxID=2528274 RepID=A0A932ZU49_UNCTE|nr:radical SAM protein [Candidatus Tectomicrobia bacterium]MBI4251688.1 radical SAM protein [Candidatus Tectomicrobia bacterium]
MKAKATRADAAPRPASTVYGPVDSWRFGRSLGVDLILRESVCSFNCVYCQLGCIQVVTAGRRLFVPTTRVMEDLAASAWRGSDLITFSGSGEPTLALNLGEALRGVKAATGVTTHVLTNGTLLGDPAVRRDLLEAGRVSVKLDAPDEAAFQRINRPAPGVTLAGVLEGTLQFRREYKGHLDTQVMFLPANRGMAEALCVLLNRIRPDEVQLNTPKRAYPSEWFLAARGRYGPAKAPGKLHKLRVIGREETEEVERIIKERTGLKVSSVYNGE